MYVRLILSYKCLYCDVSFTTTGNVLMHKNMPAKNPHLSKYPCNICGKIFSFEIIVKKHKTNKHSPPKIMRLNHVMSAIKFFIQYRHKKSIHIH